ncbi:MAG: reverse transcriptase domain-containing protein [Candidatus Thiodiazotropha sp.]
MDTKGLSKLDEITIVQWNARSLSGYERDGKLPQLLHYLESFSTSPEVICIQETWNHEGQKLLQIPGYKPPVCTRRGKGQKGGGVATFVKIGIDSEQIQYKHTNTDIEVVIVRIFGTKHNLDIANFYTPGGIPIPADTYIKISEVMGKQAILLGDFNAKNELWDSTFAGCDNNGDELISFINATDYIALNSGCGTRFNSETGNATALDLTFATASLAYKCDWYVHGDALGSDHFPVVTSVGVGCQYVRQIPAPRWKLDKADWDLFKNMTAKMNICFDDKTINGSNEIFISEIMAACEVSIPKTKPSNKPRKVLPWWDETCTAAVKNKKKAYDHLRRHRTADNLERFRQVRNECKFILESVRKQKWRDFISTLTYRANSKQVWNMIKRFNGKPYTPVDVIEIDGIRYHDSRDKAEVLTQHYQNTSSNQSLNPEFRIHKEAQEPLIDREVARSASVGEHRVYNTLFTIRELTTALNRKKSTAPGADTVHYDMLKQLPDRAKFNLLGLINESWTRGELPTQWKESTIIPLLKPGKDSHSPKSYRPISLTSAICKVMETMVANRLTSFLENKGLLSDNQSGFRRNRSTIDQILRLESAIRIARLRKRKLMAVFLDLEKAFDLMWRKGVLKNLVKFQIEGRLLAWIQEFLTGRKIRVRIGTEHSEYVDCENGSPQGSVLSPILFNVIINTLSDQLRETSVDLSQFADDSLFWKTARKSATMLTEMQNTLNLIETWANEWGFKINPSKTEVVVFNEGAAGIRRLPKLKFHGEVIDYSLEATFLGMIFDYQLNWVKHINQLVKRCTKDLNIMRLVSGTTFGADKITLIRLYTCLIRSKIDYGCQAYATASKAQLKRLDRIQATALRIATGAYRGTSTFSLEAECNIMPLAYRREELQIKYWARSSSLGEKLPINEMTEVHTIYAFQRVRLGGHIPYAINIQDLLHKYDLGNIQVRPVKYPEKHNLKSIVPRATLAGVLKKDQTSKQECSIQATKHIQNHYWGALQIFTDGSKDTENNKTGCAFVIPSIQFSKKFQLNSNLTVYTSELIAIMKALEWIIENRPDRVVILTDSLSSIQSISSGSSGTRQDILDEVLLRIHKVLILNIRLEMDWCPAHCGIAGNESADQAAKLALTKGKVLDILPAPKEIYPIIKAKIRANWAQDWHNHRGFRHQISAVLPTRLTQYSDDRQLDRVFTRLRMGVNGLKGNNLLYSGADPLCDFCGGVEDTDHYIFRCMAHSGPRAKLLSTLQSLAYTGGLVSTELLGTNSLEVRAAVFQYIKDTNYESKI